MPDRENIPTVHDELPLEFAAQHRRLLADSRVWQRQLPDTDGLNRYARQLEQQAHATLDARHPSFLRSAIQRISKGQVPPIMPHSRTRIAIPAIAVLVIVGLLGVVFAQIRSHNATTAAAVQSKPTATHVPHDTNWVHLPLLDSNAAFDSNTPTVLAPTNPQVAYQTFARGSHSSGPNGASPNANATMRRSDDGGQTWHALTFPEPATHVYYAGITVSPLDTHTVFLTILDSFKADCPSNRFDYNSEGNYYDCWLDYYSADGGAHWSAITLPFVDTGLATPVASGTGLFAQASCVYLNCSHLVTSGDGGKTWQLADQGITATMKSICLVTAAGTTIFAVAALGDCGWQDISARIVWQSDDAGAHWQRNGALPGKTVVNLIAVPSVTTPLLYTVDSTAPLASLEVPGGATSHITDVRVSADGGKTWTSAPGAGIPTGQKLAYDNGIFGILPDGRVVIQVIPMQSIDAQAGSTLMAWKAGAASWQQIAPTLNQEIGTLLATPTGATAQGTLWAVMQDRGGRLGVTPTTIFTVLRYTA